MSQISSDIKNPELLDQQSIKPKKGRKPKEKTPDQYSTKQVQDSQEKKKTQKVRKSNQQKQQNYDVLSSIQLDNRDQHIDSQDTVFRVAKLESDQIPGPLERPERSQIDETENTSNMYVQPIHFINDHNIDNRLTGFQNDQIKDQLTKGIDNLKISDVQEEQDIKIGQKQKVEQETIVQSNIDNFLSSPQLQWKLKNTDNKKKKEEKSKLQIPSYTQYQKIQQKQGKTFQEKELPQIINLSNKDGKWPQSVLTWCSYDCHPFTTTPIGIPVEITPDRKFKMQSYCCSLNCAMALIHQNNSPDLYRQINYLMEFQREFFGSTEHIPRAPTKELLQQFGGCLSIQQFRSTFQSSEQSLYSKFSEPFESSQVIQGQSIEKINPKPQYDINKSVPTEIQIYQNENQIETKYSDIQPLS